MRVWLLAGVVLSGCGEMMQLDAGVDAGRRDSGVVLAVDAGFDAGMMAAFDAGPPPPRTVFGSFTLNGVQHQLESGFVAVSPATIQLRIGTNEAVTPRLLLVMVLPGDAGAGFSAPCGSKVAFSAQHIADGGTAFFTRNSTCLVTLSAIPDAIEVDGGPDASTTFIYQGDYVGTVTASADFDPRSVFDAGYQTFGVSAGTFTVTRTF